MTAIQLTSPESDSAVRKMELRGVRVHNLKSLDLDIPLNQLVVISGVSGSGKSSLAFETLFREGQRRYIESFSVASRRHLERIERPDADRVANVPVAIAVRSDRSRGNRPNVRSTVASIGELLDGLRLLFSRLGRIVCPECGEEIQTHSAAHVVKAISELAPGARCQLGFAATSSNESDSVSAWLARGYSRAIWNGVTHDLSTRPGWPTAGDKWIVADRFVTGKSTPVRIRESAETAFREGEGRCRIWIDAGQTPSFDTCVVDGRHWQVAQFSRRLECLRCQRQFLPLEPRLFSHFSSGACPACRGTGQNTADQRGSVHCQACNGTRLREEARCVRIGDRSFSDLCQLTPPAVAHFLCNLTTSLSADQIQLTELVRADILRRLNVVSELGLGYLTLERSAETLSGGEFRRLMLAAVIGSRITGTLVIVDEPSAGLTAGEMPQVIAALRDVQLLRNSVVVVDHSPLIVAAADHFIELGPEAGPSGGKIIYQGPPIQADRHPQDGAILNRVSQVRYPLHINLDHSTDSSRIAPSLTASAAINTQHELKSNKISLSNVQHHNLHDLNVEFPLGQLCVVTGPSGCGKTSLVTQVLFPLACERLCIPCDLSPKGNGDLSGGTGLVDAMLIDQSPLTSSSRSNPATWLEVFDEIRQTFATTTVAKQRGFTSQHFSFNSSAGGRCRSCLGTGLLKHDMQFLPDITLTCPECAGTRYRQEILEVKYRGRSIADVLSMSVSEAASFFRSQPRIQARFQMLKQIGLDYLVLGQPSETLSGGEAQRLKLAARLVAPNRGACLIICDEPTAGLHPRDIGRLITCFAELIANGHSIVLADNSPELLAEAGYVVELGLGGIVQRTSS